MFDIDAAAVEMTIGVEPALGLEQLSTAGEDDVGDLQQFGFPFHDRRRCSAEFGKLIHAIVDRANLVHLTGEGAYCHRIVEPLDRLIELAAQGTRKRLPHQRAATFIDPVAIVPAPKRHLHLEEGDVRIGLDWFEASAGRD